jgi:hypothetical protein
MWFLLLTDLLLYGYYYRYRELRKQVKALVDVADYIEAKVDLDAALVEHLAKYGDLPEQRRDFNYGERIAMQHAKNHLDTAVIDQGDPSFIIDLMDGSPTTTGHHSDIVKEALLHVPKTDYSER